MPIITAVFNRTLVLLGISFLLKKYLTTTFLMNYTATEKVSDLTYAEIEQIDIGNFNLDENLEENLEEHIPRLDEVLSRVKDKAQDMVEQCMIQSFNNQVLKEIREVNSDISVGQIFYAAAEDLNFIDVDFYTIYYN